MEAFPEPVLELLGIQQGGIVEVQVPRFPRVGDVKLAASRALGIPVKDQVPPKMELGFSICLRKTGALRICLREGSRHIYELCFRRLDASVLH